jgi:hypothetical protein
MNDLFIDEKRTQKTKEAIKYCHENQEHRIDISFANLIVGFHRNENDVVEAYIGLQNNKTYEFQDIAVVRKHKSLKNTLECLLWTDKNDEDYTHKYEIGMYEAEEESNG